MSIPPATTPGAVFLSYAREDSEAARSIAAALRACGVDVWFDQNELVSGDAWDAKIKRQIRECALFVPIISATTEARHEGYFRREWKLAAERTHDMAASRAFLLPVVIDGTAEAGAEVPEEFMRVQWTKLPGGNATSAFCSRVQKLLGVRSSTGVPPVAGNHGQCARATTEPVGRALRARLVWAAAAAAAVLLGFLGWSQLKSKSDSHRPLSDSAARQSAPPTSEKASAFKNNSLVVLPLENLSSDPENAFFTDGIHSEIIETLTRLSDLKVIRRGSALVFKGSTAPLAEIAQKLGVANVIIGSVGREKDRVKISLELRRANDEAVLWGPQVYERELKEVFAIHREVAGEVSRALQARERKGTFAGAQFMTKDPRVYDLFLRLEKDYGENVFTATSWDRIIKMAEELVNLDPNFMPAVARLSTAHTNAYRVSRISAARLRHAAEAKRWAETASRLVSGGAGDGALAYYYAFVENDSSRSLVRAENLVRALPNDSTAHNNAALALVGLGREDEALLAYDRALVLDPLNATIRRNKARLIGRLRRGGEGDAGSDARFALSGELPSVDTSGNVGGSPVISLWRARSFAEVAARMESMLAEPQRTDLERFEWLCRQSDALQRLGRNEAAREAATAALTLARALEREPEFDASENHGRLARALARAGQGDAAVAAGRRFVEAVPATSLSRRRGREIALAELYAYLGRSRECVALLAKLLRVPSGLTVPILRLDPTWDNVREDPGFKALLADPKNSAPL